MSTLQFESAENMLDELSAQSRGRYFICNCPKCNEHEAFIYKNNLNYIVCNRQNNCGFSAKIEYQKEAAVSKAYERVSTMTKEKQEQLEIFSQYIAYLQTYAQEENCSEYRGLSRTTINPFILDVKKEPFVKHLYTRFNHLFKPEYVDSDHMTKRNILIPIYNDEKMIDRLLLRSSIDPNLSKKEIQILFNDGEISKNYFSDYDEDTKVIVIAESVLDALSFREIDKSVGLIGLIGNKVTGQVIQELHQNHAFFRNKHVFLALDNDRAGKETERKLEDELQKLNLPYSVFTYPDHVKDPNQFLQESRASFEVTYKTHLELHGLQMNVEVLETWEQMLKKAGIDYQEIDLPNIKEIFPSEEQENNKMSEGTNNMEMKIKHMSLIKDDKDQERGIATVQYGELTLNNLSVREVNGVPMVFTPSVKKNGEYYDVYAFNHKPPYDFDKKVVEGALIKGYYELKHGKEEKIRNREILNADHNKVFEPKVLSLTLHGDGNRSVNVAYKNVIVNNVAIRKLENGKEFVGMPSYQNKKSEYKNHVEASKVFKDQLLSLSSKERSPKRNKKTEFER